MPGGEVIVFQRPVEQHDLFLREMKILRLFQQDGDVVAPDRIERMGWAISGADRPAVAT
jgi:hypothetical protein